MKIVKNSEARLVIGFKKCGGKECEAWNAEWKNVSLIVRFSSKMGSSFFVKFVTF